MLKLQKKEKNKQCLLFKSSCSKSIRTANRLLIASLRIHHSKNLIPEKYHMTLLIKTHLTLRSNKRIKYMESSTYKKKEKK